MKNFQLIFSIYLYTQLFFISLICLFFLAPYVILPLPFCAREKNTSRIRNAVRLYGKWLLKYGVFPFIKIDYSNTSNTEVRPCIFICNHRSASDPYLMALLDTELVQIVKQWPFKLPVYGYVARKAEYISVHDCTHDEFYHKCNMLLSKGISIASFPEGTRSGTKKMGQFSSSIFRVAMQNKSVIYPVCITGNENIPNRRFRFIPGRIKVRKLNPIFWEDYQNMTPFKLKNYVRSIIMSETEKMDR